ncbi:hypothetical protein OSB04_018661 [Centaurea solstitialis]|uniref:non-specific serine/threonine protein kinase n=1 Tax=Centaurea solstitialis TaxID=347529 RepID=A0AA38WN68_9ASTR|nr:hypothetical protein OSB04_018661 [Centaurea solstitialis]
MGIHSNSIFLLLSTALFFLLSTSTALDNISANQTLKDGNTIVSQGGTFELGFFSLGNSKNRYLGIWYKKISVFTVVWVANREKPITDTSGGFKVSANGNLMVLSGGNTVIWSSNSTVSDRNLNPVAQLLETGNLVVWDTISTKRSLIWQSFNYFGDTFLPGMKIGKDLETGREKNSISWKSPDDPSLGRYLVWVDTNGYPQIKRSEGPVLLSRLGPWNGVGFSGLPNDVPNPIYSHEFVINQKEIYFRYKLTSSVVQRVHFTWDGKTLQMHWIERTQEWVVYADIDSDNCGRYAICGPYGSCNVNKRPPCSCIKGFEPTIPEEWKESDWSSGCQRKKPLSCGSADGFRRISGVKFPDTQRSWYNLSMTLGECETACRKNCNCTAYANLDIRNGGSGCLLWFDKLMDIREYDADQDLYIRLAASELAKAYKWNGVLTKVLLTSSAVLLLFAVAYACRKKNKKRQMKIKGSDLDKKNSRMQMENLDELPFFSLREVAKATDNFSINNKIGEGGFGPVYKMDENGCLKTSQQGVDEFKNEVICIAKLQHRNLVKLIGYRIHANEMILIYEYMTNKSLDSFLFDETKCLVLDWPQRFHIIHGMARGILYLHQDSRLQIIHRDLKAGNILLDADMNPKISDFGLARMFIGFDNAAKTKKVVGTYGYISPEYAVHGRFSTKSDVFSFGVLVLEIVSGTENREFAHEDHRDNLLGHAWRLYKEERSIELMSSSLCNSCIESEVVRAIHVGLLCVQHHAEDRPTMLSVVLMLIHSNSIFLFFSTALFFLLSTSTAIDTISANQTIKDGNTIVSQGNRYGADRNNQSVRMKDLDELPFFSLREVAKATDNFSINNKIGEGGFGPVYKGVLEDGKEVAVKRLSETSQQGVDEFKNEVVCIAKLQHRNLVKLLGYCIHANELILIYEYMTNKSLDVFLFDETKCLMLDWPQRFHIIHGMARGILYLHQDSRLQIIHRDLKAGNILLDADMNPKISDFGLARKFIGFDNAEKTKKVVGTYGYISPEYAVHGRFSTKSDVFSFGVLVLEIVSGKKNRECSHGDHRDNLLGHAWRLYKEGRPIELMCASLHNSCIVTEVVRSIHVALLCVQHHAEDRPTMLSVVLMLVSEGVLPQPRQPAFFTGDKKSYCELDADASMVRCLNSAFLAPESPRIGNLGIWYKKISKPTIVWVANRETPINDTSGIFQVSREGDLQILSAGNTLIWSSNSTVFVRNFNLKAQLLENGNLVLLDETSTKENPIWQSFDYLGDTLLPGMKIGKDLVTGRERHSTSWKSPDDPCIGLYKIWMDTNGYPQIFQREGEALHARLGPWNGVGFDGFPIENPNPIYSVEFVVNEKEIYYRYELKSSVVQRIVVSWDGVLLRLIWIERIQEWVVDGNIMIVDSCGRYGRCGPYGMCSINMYPPCRCVEGFEPKFPKEWNATDWSGGCKHRQPLHCGSGDGFRKISGLNFPDTRHTRYNVSMTLEECEVACRKNCSCTAYANLDMRNGGSGCLLWFDELTDMREYDEKQELLRLMVSQSGFNKKKVLTVVLSISSAALLLSALAYACRKTKKRRGKSYLCFCKLQVRIIVLEDFHNYNFFVGNRNAHGKKDISVQMEDLDALPFFSLHKIAKATDNFSINNKIGEGGFGPVYKGVLDDGRSVAVKRLSETSQQGIEEFKNEVVCIAKLHHRNLVKLLGYCIHGNELILIYEYMANKSLDSLLFDETRSSILNWPQRFHIIQGMARGILYLHQDSRLQIIHRDLKAGNVLLDGDMNPKISDFGLARMFVGSDAMAKTKKVVGTYGYISPEYAVHGRFSTKSDVFSFGVLVLEIVSGKKNRGFCHDGHGDNLLGHAWRLYKENKSIEIMSASLHNSRIYYEQYMLRYYVCNITQKIGQLCCLMLVSEGALPPPKQPAFFTEESFHEHDFVSSQDEYMITLVYAR